MEGKFSFCHFILFVICVDPKSTIQSRTVVVYPNQRVHINCSLNSKREFSQWSFASVGRSSSPSVLVSAEAGLGSQFKDRFDFNPEDPDVLTIRRAGQQDAGRYTCKKYLSRGPESNMAEFSTEIIFLYGNMSCAPTDVTRVTEGESITLQCSISYKGNLRAVMEWRETDGRSIDSQQTTNYTAADDPNSTTATSSLRLKTDRLIWKNSKFVCTAHFINMSAVNGQDDASPILQWTSPQFTLQYKPHNVKISPAGEDGDFYPGDSLNCSADALPEAEFKWKIERNKTRPTFNGNTFTIEEPSPIDELMLLTCTAENSLGSANISKLITIRSRYLIQKSAAATNGVSCVLLVLLTVLTVQIIHLKKDGIGGQDNKTTEQRAEEETSATEIDNYAELGARDIPVPSIFARLEKQIPQKSTFSDSETFEGESSREETSDYANDDSAVYHYVI